MKDWYVEGSVYEGLYVNEVVYAYTSTAGSCRTSAFLLAIRVMPRAMVRVTMATRPSGITDKANDTPT